MAREQAVDLLALGPWHERVERGAEMGGGDGGKARFAGEVRREPVRVGGEGGVREVGPVLAQGAAEEGDAAAEGLLVLAPGEGFGALQGRFGEEARGGIAVRDRDGIVGQAQGIEPALAAGADGTDGGVEGQRRGGLDTGGEDVLEIGRIERGGGTDTAGGGGPGDVGDDEERRRREGMSFLELRLAAIGEAEAPARASGLGDAIGESTGKMPAGGFGRAGGGAAGEIGPAAGKAARLGGAGGAIGAEAFEAMGEIGVVAPEAAFADEDGQFGGRARIALAGCGENHVRKPRMERQAGELAAFGGKAATIVDGIEPGEEGAGFGPGGRGRGIEEAQGRGVGNAPGREVEHEARKVGGKDFGSFEGVEGAGLALIPEADADAGFGAAGAAAALVGGGAGDAAGGEGGKARGRLVDRDAAIAAIDDDADTLDCERGFSDGGGERDLAAAGRGGIDSAILLGRRELAIERGKVDIGREAGREALGGAGDLGLAGRKTRAEPGWARSAASVA